MRSKPGQPRPMQRILVYTHNAIGLGHAVRTMAVISGIRAARPHLDWLVLSGTSVPQIFLREGVEVVKLPGLRHALDRPGQPYIPRLLKSFTLEAVLDWRRRLIRECLKSYRPDVIMMEHSLVGLMGEADLLLAARIPRGPAAGGLGLVHLSRGIYRASPQPLLPPGPHPRLPPGTNILQLFDAFYVLEDPAVVDLNREHLGREPALEAKIRYFGRIAARNRGELNPTHDPFRTPPFGKEPFVLIVLGRYGRILDLHLRLLEACHHLGLHPERQVLVVGDPYLNPEIWAALKAHPAAHRARFVEFTPDLVEVMARADLVVCRAGYNSVNEVLLTGVRALVIPEPHPSGEQERRAAGIPGPNVQVLPEVACLSAELERVLSELLNRPPCPMPVDFDRFRIGRAMADDLDRLFGKVPGHGINQA